MWLNLSVLYVAFVRGEKFHRLLNSCKLFRQIFADAYSQAGKHKIFSGNEGKDVKQWNIFTVNKKEYMVCSCI